MPAINLGSSAKTRYSTLVGICDAVLLHMLPEDDDAEQRMWARAFFTYLMWWEGGSATTRTQYSGGPGRGLMQFEPATIRDLYNHYANVVNRQEHFIDTVGWALSADSAAAANAFEAFLKSTRPLSNRWPTTNSKAAPVQAWLLNDDTFGIALMYLQLTRGTAKKIPPRLQSELSKSPYGESYKTQHAEFWARYWKRSFSSPKERKKQISNFTARATEADLLGSF